MARITTTNYAGASDTTFAWATSGSDRFNREDDLYNLARALEIHDHSAGKGLPVGRIGNAVITSAMIGNGEVKEANVGNDAIKSIAIALDTIGALDIAAGAVGTSELADLGVTAAKLSATAIADKLGYTPASGSGGVIAGNVQIQYQLIMAGVPGHDGEVQVYERTGTNFWDITNLGGDLFILRSSIGQGLKLGDTEAEFQWYGHKVFTSNNVGSGSGNDADTLRTRQPSATSGANVIVQADGTGKIDSSFLTAPGTSGNVPTGMIASFRTAAEIPAVTWAAETNLSGRIPVGADAGGALGKAIVENTNYNSTWAYTPAGTVAVVVATALADRRNANIAFGSGSDNVMNDHAHGITSQTFTGTAGEWAMPIRGVVYARKA